MKLFFYKSLIIFFLFLLSFHLSFGYLLKKIKTEISIHYSKDNAEILKSKIREEMKNAINKETYINPEDAKLINQFINKIKEDLKKSN